MGNKTNMKTILQRFNVIMFLLAILNIQTYSSLEIASLTKVPKLEKADNFEQLCYYDLKVDLIIKNYVIRVEDEVAKIFDKNDLVDRNKIKFEFFFKAFKQGNYGKIAPELAGSEDYVRSYWNYFQTKKGSDTMTEKDFTKFMGLYYLEGELLIIEAHPTLTEFFPNEHNVNRRIGCNVGLAFWELTTEYLQRIFIQFKYSMTNQKVTKTEIFTIVTNTHTGKCQIMMDKKCPFFTNFIGKVMGFFNMSAGKREYLLTKETKVAYSTFLFSDVYDKSCKQVKFDAETIQKKIKAIKFNKD